MALSELEASLVYKVSSRTARTVSKRNPVSKNKQTGQSGLQSEFQDSKDSFKEKVCLKKQANRKLDK